MGSVPVASNQYRGPTMNEPARYSRWLMRWPTGIVATIAGVAFLTGAMAPMLDVRQVLVVGIVYLAFTLLMAALWGYRVGLFAAVVSDLLVNFFFMPPLYTFTVSDPNNVAALVLLLAAAIFGAWLVGRLRQSVTVLRAQQAENAMLLATMTRSAEEPRAEAAVQRFCEAVAEILGSSRCEIVRCTDDEWLVVAASDEHQWLTPEARTVADEAMRQNRIHGDMRSRRVDEAVGGFVTVPFPASAGMTGVLRVAGPLELPDAIDRERLLRALAAEAAATVHRLDLATEAREARRAQVAEAFKGTILSTLSHDLRSPLTAIKAAATNLRDPAMTWSADDTTRFLEVIETQTDRVTGLVTDLLELSRLDAGAVNARLEPIDVGALLQRVADATGATGRRIVIASRPPTMVRADARLLQQAVGNLVENAAHYSLPSGLIRLDYEAHAERVAITIADEGPGIPAADLPHVFERFYRGVQAQRTTGTGLGLAITRALVELCGGSVDVTSSLDGTTFTITLPRASGA